MLVIFSDGLDEDVMKLEQESELLRQSGKTSVCNFPVLIAWLYLNDQVDDVDPTCMFWRAVNAAVCREMSSFVCFLCRCQRSADCGAGGSAWPGPAADGGVWTRIRIQASSQHRHAECWQRPPQTNCKSVMSLKTETKLVNTSSLSKESVGVINFLFTFKVIQL